MTRFNELSQALDTGWCAAPWLCQQFKWKPNTLRGAVSQINTKFVNAGSWLRVERKREDGVTFYRVVKSDGPQDDGQPTETQEWQDYDRDC